ncbi:TIGR03620 family F420-dependent LLM class oxidoreductase [Actinoplanes sp. NPDC051633]|uniref:TIGR03620 family F420-dependent LLM class oxidoreductase n=1 Tax=Actinoplanes sp. NPDC051633 TaxID=3155670 RepID=UPI003439671C
MNSRYGLWVSRRSWPAESSAIAAAAAEVEALGYGSLWIGGSPPDDLRLPEAVLAGTTSLVVGTSIVDIWSADPAVLATSHQRIRDSHPGRFYLGVGSGHAPTAEAQGQAYVRPLSRLRQFLDALGDRVPAEELMIAALGPKALELAATRTAGALPYLVPAAHTADARAILSPGLGKLLIPEQKVVLGTDERQARAAGRRGTKQYLRLPNYLNNLRRYGLTDADFAGDGSDRWVDTLVAWGDGPAVKRGVDAHLDAGADHVAVQVLPVEPRTGLPRAEWAAVAEVLLADA